MSFNKHLNVVRDQGGGGSNPLSPTNQTRPFLFQGFASRPIQCYLNSSLSPSSSLAIVIRQPASKKSGWLSFGWLRPVVPLRCASGGRRWTARLGRALGLSTVRAKPEPNPFGTTRADTSRPATLRSAAFLLSPSVPDVLFRCA